MRDVFVKGLLGDVEASYLLRDNLLEVEAVADLVLDFVLDGTQNVLHIHDGVV